VREDDQPIFRGVRSDAAGSLVTWRPTWRTYADQAYLAGILLLVVGTSVVFLLAGDMDGVGVAAAWTVIAVGVALVVLQARGRRLLRRGFAADRRGIWFDADRRGPYLPWGDVVHLEVLHAAHPRGPSTLQWHVCTTDDRLLPLRAGGSLDHADELDRWAVEVTQRGLRGAPLEVIHRHVRARDRHRVVAYGRIGHELGGA
jgi:hypothetical protein